MKRLSIAAVVSVLLCLIAVDQASAQGSPYNLVGFGEIIPARNPRIEGLGGAGVALDESRMLNDLNPAGWTFLNRARFETFLRLEYNNLSDASTSGRQSDIHFGGFGFGAPIWEKYKSAISLGIRPITIASSEIVHTDSAGSHTYRGAGGLDMGYIGIAARPVSAIALGARLDVLFGNIRHVDQLTFTDPEVAPGQYERDYASSGMRGTFGLDVIGDSISESLSGLTLGLSYSTGSALSVTKRDVYTALASSFDTALEYPGTGSFPAQLTAGVGLRFGTRYRAAADYTMQDFSSSFVYSASGSQADPTLRNSTRFAIGIERLANLNSEYGYGGFWDRIGLRAGFHYAQLPMSPIGTGGINELAASFGVGVPVSFESMIDLGLTLGQRTPTNAGTAPKDMFMRLGASVSLSERWFTPTRTE